MLTNHNLLRITTSARIYIACDNQSHSAPFADQSALTAAITSLGSAHLDWYKRHSSQPAVVSDHLSNSATTSVSQHAWPRVTGLRSHRHYTVPGMAASALRLSCPTHWATGCLDSPVAIPHTLGNWRFCHMPPLQRLRSTTRQPPHTTNTAAQLQPTAISTSARTTSFYRRIQHHITGQNKRPFSGPHKLYGVNSLIEQ
jgi:hypothetical protein